MTINYNNLDYYYSKQEILEILNQDSICAPENHRSRQKRGGWFEGVGYDDALVNAKTYHYLNHSMGSHNLDKGSRDLLECLNLLARVGAQRMIPDYVLGECCVRVIWYEAATETRTLGFHTDTCAVTYPLFDSCLDKPGSPFFGQMAQEMGLGKAKKHGFALLKKPRVFIAGFVQLPMDTLMPNGQRYGDRLAELVSAQFSGNNREY